VRTLKAIEDSLSRSLGAASALPPKSRVIERLVKEDYFGGNRCVYRQAKS
jgi:hypothetical protein